MVICLEQGADLHMMQLMPLPLTVSSVKSRLVLHFWYWLTRAVPEKGPLNGCVCGDCVCFTKITVYLKSVKVNKATVRQLSWNFVIEAKHDVQCKC